MLVYYRRNKQTACYDSEQLLTVSRTKPPELIRRPFASCGDCPYPSHGFQCYAAEGDCLSIYINTFQQIQLFLGNDSVKFHFQPDRKLVLF